MKKKQVFIHSLTTYLYFPFGALLAFIAFRYPNLAMYYGGLVGLCLPILAACLLLPVGRLRFTQDRSAFFPWFLKVIGIEVLLMIMFLGGIVAYFGAGPSFSYAQITLDNLQTAIHAHQWLLWSFFPWGCLAIWVVCSCYYYYFRRVGPYPHQAASETLRGFMEPRSKAYIETSFYSINTLCFAVIMAAGICLAAYALQISFNLVQHTILAPISFTVMAFVVVFALWRFTRKRLIVMNKKGLRFGGFLLIITVALIVSLVFSSVAIEWILKKAQVDIDRLVCGHCHRFFETTESSDRFAAYFFGWGLMCIPLAGSVLVKISRGRSLREIVFGITLLPLIIYVIGWYDYTLYIQGLHDLGLFASGASNAQKIFILSFLSISILLPCLLMARGVNNSQLFNAGVLEPIPGGQIGRMRLSQGVKLMGFSRICVPFMLALITAIFMHMVGGWYLIQVNVVLFAPVMMHHLYGAYVFVVHQFKRRNLWFHPETPVKPFIPYEKAG